MSEPVIFKVGTKDRYSSLTSHPSNVIYFLTDTGEIYKGDIQFGGGGSGIELDNTWTTSTTTAPTTNLVKTTIDELSTSISTLNNSVTNINRTVVNKADKLTIYNMTTMTHTIHLAHNSEYRYFASAISKVNVTLPAPSASMEFYCSIVCKISGVSTIADFIDSTLTIKFLNGDTDISECTTIEVLIFYNGTNYCAIGYGTK